MSLMFEPLRRYADFNGRATRTEYWLFQLFMVLLLIAAAVLVAIAGAGASSEEPSPLVSAVILLGIAAWLALIIPNLAVLVRRLHDTGNSGFWVFIGLVPLGGFVLFVFSLIPGTPGPNAHGPDPRDGATVQRPVALSLN